MRIVFLLYFLSRCKHSLQSLQPGIFSCTAVIIKMKGFDNMENLFADLIASLWLLIRPVLSAAAPLLTGITLAWTLNPAVDRLSPRLGTGKAILVTYVLLFAALTALAASFAVLILGALPTDGVENTAHLIMDYFHQAYNAATGFLDRWLPSDFADVSQAAEGVRIWLRQRFSIGALVSDIRSLSGGAINFFLGVIASIYLLKDKDYFILLRDRFLSLILKQRTHGILCEICGEINSVLSSFIKGALIDSLLIALLSSAALSLLGIDYAVIIGILSGILNIIPYFGPFISMVPAFLVALITGGPAKSAAAVLLLFFIQQIDSNYIYPRVVGKSTGLHPLFVLLSVSAAGYFFGLAGMLLAVPAAGILQVLLRRWAFR